MAEMTGQDQPFFLEANHYHIRDAAKNYVAHPIGLPALERNTVIVGPLGVGKTMLVKSLCYQWSRDKERKLTLYIDVQRLLSRIEAESAPPYETKTTPRDIELAKCANILLTIGLLYRLIKYADAPILPDLLESLRVPLFGGKPVETRLRELAALVEKVLDYQQTPAKELEEFPSFSYFLPYLGSVCRNHGKTLIILLDQVDKIPPLVFKELGGFLKRGDHLTLMATRPYPCAPEPTALPAQMDANDDFEVIPMASHGQNHAWENFISRIIYQSPFDSAVKIYASENLSLLTAVSGYSVRNALNICVSMRRLLRGAGTEIKAAWEEALTHFIAGQETMALAIMGAYANKPEYALEKIQGQCVNERQRLGEPDYGPCVIRVIGEITPTGDPLLFLRRCTREGLIVPTNNCAIDPPLHEFRLSPSLLGSAGARQAATFASGREVRVNIHTDDLRKWLDGPGRSSSKKVKVIFVPYWMTEPLPRTPLAEKLQAALQQTVHVSTGDSEDRGYAKPVASDIKRMVKESDLVVVDLVAYRREILVEFGWAIGFYKPVLFVRPGQGELDSDIWWLNEWQISSYDEDAQFHGLLRQIQKLLRGPVDRVSAWKSDPDGFSLPTRADPRTIGVIGREEHMEAIVDSIKESCRERKLECEPLLLSHARDREERGGLLYKAISLARRSVILIVGLDGSSIDPLSCVAGGVFSAQSHISIQGARRQRELIVAATDAVRKQGRVPQLLRGGGTVISREQDTSSTLEDSLRGLHNWMLRIQAQHGKKS